MKYHLSTTLYLVIISTSFSLIADTIEPMLSRTIEKKPSPERAENAKFVLANIAQMIGHIGTIVEERHNADNVGNAVTSIVGNIVKITMHAVQNKQIDIQDAHNIMNTLQEICKDLDDETLAMINVKKLQLLS